MKKARLKELAGQLLGTVTDHPDALEHFSTDASVFFVTPDAVAYPQNTADVRKIVAFASELATTGKPAGVIARGHGSGTAGGAVGEGMQVVFPAHMNKTLQLSNTTVTVQPGLTFATLQQILATHGRYIPACPEDAATMTVGAAVADNVAGEHSLKYGPMRDYIKALKVVLADGSLTKTQRLSARELNRKKGITSLEGEIYRKLDSILLDHAQLIKKQTPRLPMNTTGYALNQVRQAGGSFDLGQIFIGAGSTLGLITEITLSHRPLNPRTTLVVGYCDTLEHAAEVVPKIAALCPSTLEFVDSTMLELLRDHRPGDLKGLVPEQLPGAVLFIEFDDFSQLSQKYRSLRAQRILNRHHSNARIATDPIEQVALWKLRRNAPASTWLSASATRQPLPFIDSAAVPIDQLPQLFDRTIKLLKKYELQAPMWGSVGAGQLHLRPLLDLGRKKDVDRLFSLAREFHATVIALGGTPGSGSSDGLLRGPSLEGLYGEEMVKLFSQVKHIFDPQGILYPAQKSLTEDYARSHLRPDYSLNRFLDQVMIT